MSVTVQGMTETGRRLAGPAADLVQLDASNGFKHTALVYRQPFVQAACLNAELQGTIPFMESPKVEGLVPLVSHDRDSGTFVYKTGTIWAIAEVVRAFADLGETCGHRAGLELAYVTSQILMEASEAGSPHGVWSHRSLSPWRIGLRGDGQVRVLGYGIPQVELIEHLAHESSPIKEDSFRYAPPERIEGREEDITSDLFALTLIAVELMVGKPVYDGLLADVRQQAARAEGTYRLYRWRELLPATIRDALAPALKYDDDARYRDPAEYVYAMHDLLGSPDIEGPSLMEIVQRVKMAERKGKPIVSGRTAALTREELAAMAAEIDEPDELPLPPPSMPRPNAPQSEVDPDAEAPRWGSVSRGGRRPQSDAPQPASAPEPEESSDRLRSLRQRLRRSRSEGPPSRAAESEDDAKEALRKRLRERSAPMEGSTGSAGRRSAPERSAPKPEPAPVESAPEPPPVPTTPSVPSLSTSSGGAEALLARLRSSSGRRRGGALRSVATPTAPAPLDTPATPSQTAPPKPATGTVTWTLRDGTTSRSETVREDEPICVLSARLGAPHTALDGRLISSPRLSQEGRWWRGHELARNLDPSLPVDVAQVPNDTVRLEVRTDGSPGHRFMAPVSLAVPAQQIIAHLVRWLALPEGEWQLRLGDDTLLAEQLLADLEPADGQILLLRR